MLNSDNLIFKIALTVQGIAAIRAVMYYRRNPYG